VQDLLQTGPTGGDVQPQLSSTPAGTAVSPPLQRGTPAGAEETTATGKPRNSIVAEPLSKANTEPTDTDFQQSSHEERSGHVRSTTNAGAMPRSFHLQPSAASSSEDIPQSTGTDPELAHLSQDCRRTCFLQQQSKKGKDFEFLGRGGFGEIYKFYSKVDGMEIACKISLAATEDEYTSARLQFKKVSLVSRADL
jgi:hypothetical protein